MKINKNNILYILCLTTIVAILPFSARALNYEYGHQQMIIDLVELIKEKEGLPISNGTEAEKAFWETLSIARASLSELKCDLPIPYTPYESIYCYLEEQREAKAAYWQARAEDPDDLVYSVEYSHESERLVEVYEGEMYEWVTTYCYKVKTNPPQDCGYDEIDDMNNFGDVLIKELRYEKFERDVTSGQCFMRLNEEASSNNDIDSDTNSDSDTDTDTDTDAEPPVVEPYIALGGILGRWTGKVDDEVDDTVLWIKPSNSRAAEVRTDILETAINASLTPLKVLVASFYCLGRFFSGRSCNWGDGMDLFPDIPIDTAIGAMPGMGRITNKDYVGLWHMMQLDAKQNGEFNDIPGTIMENAGPNESVGSLDMLAMTIADIIGASLNARQSGGVSRYGEHDQRKRSYGEWQSENIGLLEFSSLASLAEYGWDEFKKDPTHSKYLGWPLHALGDTIVPHHLVGTASHGHAPFEKAMDFILSDVIESSKQEILERGFFWWNKYCYNKEMKKVSDMIEDVSIGNRDMIGAWAWQDDASVAYRDADSDRELETLIAKQAYLEQPNFISKVQPLVVNSSGAALALLLCASQTVNIVGHSEETKCPAGYKYCPSYLCGFQCVENYDVPEPEDADSDLEMTVPTTNEIVPPIIVI